MGKVTTRVHVDKIAEVVLGEGRVVVGHSTNYRGGFPALTFSPAPEPGEVGTDFIPSGPYELAEGSVVLVFATKEAVLAHLKRLAMLVEEIEASQKSGD